jgi:membrane-associated protease RseP (regulator of RpoE activity)
MDLSSRNIDVALFQIIARTQRLTSFIDYIARKLSAFWKAFAYAGIVAAFGAMALTTVNFLFVGRMLFEKPSEATGVQLVIPGVTVPLLYSLIAIVTVVVVHEFAHGIIARLNKIPIKSVGIGLLAVLPFAFVEPEEEGMKAASPLARIQVLAAGSMANFTTALVALGIIFLLVVPSLTTAGLSIAGVEADSPAEVAGLQDGMIIRAITYGGTTTVIESYDDFSRLMDGTLPSTPLTLDTSAGEYTLMLAEHPSRDVGYIGISTYDRSVLSSFNPIWAFLYPPIVMGIDAAVFPDAFSSLGWFFIDCLKYIFFLNVGIGLFNMLPIGPIDGGQIFREVLKKLFGEKAAKSISTVVSVALAVVIISSLVLPQVL